MIFCKKLRSIRGWSMDFGDQAALPAGETNLGESAILSSLDNLSEGIVARRPTGNLAAGYPAWLRFPSD
jgi:hypothetical protein